MPVATTQLRTLSGLLPGQNLPLVVSMDIVYYSQQGYKRCIPYVSIDRAGSGTLIPRTACTASGLNVELERRGRPLQVCKIACLLGNRRCITPIAGIWATLDLRSISISRCRWSWPGYCRRGQKQLLEFEQRRCVFWNVQLSDH